MQSSRSFDYTREPFLIVFKEEQPIKETYAGEIGTVVVEGQRMRPAGVESKTVVVFMHPIGGTQYLPLPTALARAGIHVISCTGRRALGRRPRPAEARRLGGEHRHLRSGHRGLGG
jgi:hypothetical protein